MKLGILRETTRNDEPRVALTPEHARQLMERFASLKIVAQPSNIRIYTNEEYLTAGIEIQENLSDCDLLIGVKEVSVKYLIEGKKYLFFAHVAKKQIKNQRYFQELAKQKITLIDFEYLKNVQNKRLISFSYWAGIAGCNYALVALLRKLQVIENIDERQNWHQIFNDILIPPVKLVLTGSGQSAKGASDTLKSFGFQYVTPNDFSKTYAVPVFTILRRQHHFKQKNGLPYSAREYHQQPEKFNSSLIDFIAHTDAYLACHYWEKRYPVFLSREDFLRPDLKLKVIADITCDINGSLACTIRESTHLRPYYDFNPVKNTEEIPFSGDHVTVMAIGNLPAAMAREASYYFSATMMQQVIPFLLHEASSDQIERATILKNGELSSHFNYLYDFLNSKS